MVAAYTQLLAERYHGKLDEQADKYIHYAVDGALRMQALIQDLLAFSRAGRQGMEMEPADCNLVIGEALANLQLTLHESGAVVNYEPLPVVLGNAPQLRQVFQNLIANAIKFHGPQSPVVRISSRPSDEGWQFSVQDNGIGIALEDVNSIFVVFQRLHTRMEYPGNGIGLAICKKIIERHGGRIWVESREGEGSTFKFILPALPSAKPAVAQAVRSENYEQPSRSLVG